MALEDPQCVLYVRLVKKISLISFSNSLSLDIFGTLGGMCGTNHVGMFPHWRNYFLYHEPSLQIRFLQDHNPLQVIGQIHISATLQPNPN